ncbi:bifunctional class I SAM-dependent methyltransferase/N-acetyltransferase [Streptomyces sp. MP131-18]|uniref:bifunctional class I SAM-dependent methyltransferase/N-acetyltransferase n=1 Tax=Streptomyces sp. MP131-18 TaxID=1857892 RepID=UPI00097BBAE8|nr:bifunctional class I SAM-dependent methyltransferase/N-acetyltransferase [Streptomyces sp. MP131-18]ONK15826.1 Demethylrebeccamycin-D-glucose O-methyltransferase [Streptomyces sp. MP131-18]
MSTSSPDHRIDALLDLHRGLPRQGPGSDATTRRLLALAGELPARPRVLDAGCGPGRAALLLAAEAGAEGADVVAVDLHRPYLDELDTAAARLGLGARITTLARSMTELPYPDHSFDVIWAEGSVYTVGFDTALRAWRRLLAPGGVLVVTEAEWATRVPSPECRAFWDAAAPLRTTGANVTAAEAAGYRVDAVVPLPESDWWAEYYDPLAERIAAADTGRPGMAEAVAASGAEIRLRREYGREYRYTGYVLRHDPRPGATGPDGPGLWHVRPETAADAAAVREVLLAAFPTPLEADLVDALRNDAGAWRAGLSFVACTPDGLPAGYALLTRCHVGSAPALALAPCAVLPAHQRSGAGSAAIRAALGAARAAGEDLVLVLGHPQYYPRFGFVPASRFGIRVPFEVPDEAMMALPLGEDRAVPQGTVRYPAAFGL